MSSTSIAKMSRLLLGLLLIGASWLSSTEAQAQSVKCENFSISSLAFGSFSPFDAAPSTNGNLSFRCYSTQRNGWLTTAPSYYVALCIHLGTGSGAATGVWSPRVMPSTVTSSSSRLGYQVYQSGVTVWGSRWNTGSTPMQLKLGPLAPMDFGSNAPKYASGSASYAAQVISGQSTVSPGSYQGNYGAGDTEVFAVASTSSNVSCLGSTANSDTGLDSSFSQSFTISATVLSDCQVTATAMNFNNTESIAPGAITQNSTVNARCTNSTAFNIALSPGGSPAPTNGTGRLTNAGTSLSDPDTYLNYSLFQDASFTKPWGSQIGTNTVSSNGTGNYPATPWTVYGRISNVNINPGTYSDTVTVKVSY
ncbi:Csu type fimbrial protein [Diaphorobacter caeni]|uniref:Csu type fimbrial protein n=1 Tax=Diaphorobacter caeni TaxID=2784387 RepID=UPI00188DFE6F|nr:spore coat protein U domain-containing protein [Diaphorobacter caeni]MBF5002810.1 spore coat U domain-containing protein [Diaphorobacter caeni]